MNLYRVTKFSPYFPFTLFCFYTEISSFMPVLTIGIVRDCFYLLIFYSEKFSTWFWRLPFAVNVNLNLSNISQRTTARVVDHPEIMHTANFPLCVTQVPASRTWRCSKESPLVNLPLGFLQRCFKSRWYRLDESPSRKNGHSTFPISC